MESSETLCPLCNRPIAEPCNRHHLIPLSKGGKATPTVIMHKICHSKIHAMYNENELKRYYNTIERLQEGDEMQKFLKWLKNKPPEFYDASVKKPK